MFRPFTISVAIIFSACVCICDDLCLSDQGKFHIFYLKLCKLKNVKCNADMTSSKKNSLFEKISNQLKKISRLFLSLENYFANFKTFSRVQDLVRTLADYVMLICFIHVWNLTSGVTEGKTRIPLTIWKISSSYQNMAANAWNWYQRWLEEIGAQISIWNISFGKAGLPSQMFQCSWKFPTKTKSCIPLGSKWILLNFFKW